MNRFKASYGLLLCLLGLGLEAILKTLLCAAKSIRFILNKIREIEP